MADSSRRRRGYRSEQHHRFEHHCFRRPNKPSCHRCSHKLALSLLTSLLPQLLTVMFITLLVIVIYLGSISALSPSPSSASSLTRHRKLFRSSSSNSSGSISGNFSTLYIELLVVHDHGQYIDFNMNETEIVEKTKQIVNIMNALYKELNIYIALVGVVVWSDHDEVKLTDDGDATLTNFLKYRHDKLLPKYPHDNAQLITKQSFNGSVVGKALKGPICTHEHSGGINTNHSDRAAVVAVTLAHELGHNLGMEHDDDSKCKCPEEKCIMSSSSSTIHPKYWSSCSIDYLNDARKHGLLECLENEPEKDFGPVCGNGAVEEGEECDPGVPLPNYKNYGNYVQLNPCCDGRTCKFVKNATCANGPCCDLTRCSLYSAIAGKVCRHRSSECDFEEVCDGIYEHCPPDVYYHDGIECGLDVIPRDFVVNSLNYNRSKSFCYQGKCASHKSQCQLLWGDSARVSRNICYEQNSHGNTSGNCGYDRESKIYLGCEHEDALCGMLHCIHNQQGGDLRRTGKLGYGFESSSTLTVSFFTAAGRPEIYCHAAMIDAGVGIRDPGLVPNGAACGEDKMCLNQRCLPVYQVLTQDWCSSGCSGNGICDNLGVCHCSDGSTGSSCYLVFGLNLHFSMVLCMIMFFVPIVSMSILIINHFKPQIKLWWYVQNRKIALLNKASKTSTVQRRSLPRGDVHITRPIQLVVRGGVNQQVGKLNGINVDPWNDRPHQANRSATLALLTELSPNSSPVAGFKLEPLASKPTSHTHSNKFKQQSSDLKPVRPAPPPPLPATQPPMNLRHSKLPPQPPNL